LGKEAKNLSITLPTNEHMLELQNIVSSYGLHTYIGG
jgi:hypothetical protein